MFIEIYILTPISVSLFQIQGIDFHIVLFFLLLDSVMARKNQAHDILVRRKIQVSHKADSTFV